MKLESSLHSPAGLPRNRTDDLNYAEERMAARLVDRLGVKPPIDVEKICGGLADLTFKKFPIEIDGICLDLKKKGKRPKIWVSKDMPRVRKRFTIAHEIGHIIIPWHTGTIIDDIDAPRSKEASRYREMEAEANRFAAELLMPTKWVSGFAERAEHACGLMTSINRIAEVSLAAAFLKTAKLGKAGYVGAEIRDGIVTRSRRTSGTHSRPIEIGSTLENLNLPAASEPQILHGQDVSYYWWKIHDAVADPGGDLPDWRSILELMLEDIPPEERQRVRSSVNAIVGLAIGRVPKGTDVAVIYRRGLESIQNRTSENYWIARTLANGHIKDYVLARARERASVF